MKVRNDSPFAKLTEEQRTKLLAYSKKMAVEDLVKMVKTWPERIECSIPAMRRFLRRIQEEELIADAEEADENVGKLARRGESKEVRDATLAAARQRMFGEALSTNDHEALLELFSTMNEEKARERQLELDERKVKVAEENAKLGWKKLEYDRSVAAAKLLPKVWEILTDVKIDPQERAMRAQECMAREGARLLPEILVGSDGPGLIQTAPTNLEAVEEKEG